MWLDHVFLQTCCITRFFRLEALQERPRRAGKVTYPRMVKQMRLGEKDIQVRIGLLLQVMVIIAEVEVSGTR